MQKSDRIKQLAEYEFSGEKGLMCKVFRGDVHEYYSQERYTAAFCLGFLGEKILLTKHVSRGWEIPGGRREEGETIEETMMREFQEETRYTVQGARPFGRFEMTKNGQIDICPIYTGKVGAEVASDFVDDAVGSCFFSYSDAKKEIEKREWRPLLDDAFFR